MSLPHSLTSLPLCELSPWFLESFPLWTLLDYSFLRQGFLSLPVGLKQVRHLSRLSSCYTAGGSSSFLPRFSELLASWGFGLCLTSLRIYCPHGMPIIRVSTLVVRSQRTLALASKSCDPSGAVSASKEAGHLVPAIQVFACSQHP